MNSVEALLKLLLERGARQYGDEPVSELAHALQCATQAERSGAAPALIVAALLHDIGHLVDGGDEAAARDGVDAVHERIGATALASLFGPEVTEPVRLHVPAKRYLCAAEPAYEAALSFASQRSLALQGGRFTAEDARAFLDTPFAADAVALRRWDEAAKDPNAETPGLEHFAGHIRQCAVARRTR